MWSQHLLLAKIILLKKRTSWIIGNERNIMAFRRTVKNVVRNFSDIEVKVREATSNDPWGPSSSLMGEIADATYNVAAFSSIMSMLWKRLNDHGKNWRHVYKSLTVLDYIIKTGSDRVAQQCRENLFAIQTLKDFQFIDKDGKDQGMNVREKSKQIVALLKDEERLKTERQRALKAKERFAQSQGGVGNKNFRQNRKFTSQSSGTGDFRSSQDDSSIPSQTSWDVGRKDIDSHSTDGRLSLEYEKARPSNEAEEELQLQIALAMSKEEAEQSQKIEAGDEKRLELALKESGTPIQAEPPSSTLLDLTAQSPVAVSSQAMFDPWTSSSTQAHATSAQPAFSAPPNNPWPAHQSSTVQAPFSTSSQATPVSSDPWSSASKPTQVTQQSDPWGSHGPQPSDPWKSTSPIGYGTSDPFSPQVVPTDNVSNGFDPRANSTQLQPFSTSNPFDLTPVDQALPKADAQTPDFLGNNAKLVDLDDIVGSKTSSTGAAAPTNPFASTITPKPTNPFSVEKPKAKSINELRSEQTSFASENPVSGVHSNVLLPSPLLPDSGTQTANSNANPFLL